MKIAWLKEANEKIPAWMKKPFGSFLRKRLIQNEDFLQQYALLCRFDECGEEERDLYQLKALKEMLIYADRYVPYYHEVFQSCGFNPHMMSSLSDMRRIPILKKKVLQENFQQLVSTEPLDSYLVTTGGTTGKPAFIDMERAAIYREWAFVYHYWSKFGYDYKTSKLATFRGVDFGKTLWMENPLYREIRLNPMRMAMGNVRRYVEAINHYGADFLYGYPSAIYNFCRLCQLSGIDLRGRFQAVFLISENLYPYQSECIEQNLEAPIAMFYGHSERAVFAGCFHNKYYFHKAYGVLELSEEGRPVVTGFINRKMPLIRYEVDDFIRGNDIEGYHIFGHHEEEVLYGTDGQQISVASINFHDDTFAGVHAYQFLQQRPGECTLCVQINDGIIPSPTLVQRLKARVSEKLGLICDVKVVDEMILSKRGKYKMIIHQ